MNNELTQIDPKMGFMIVKNEQLSNLASESIDLLYQPIIGAHATALVRLLWHWNQAGDGTFNQHPHHELFALLQIDAPHFNECRHKLEGVGLLKTFIQKTDSKPVLIYQLVAPLSNREFFDDDLLSLALLDNVGADLYQRLAQRLLIKPFPLNEAQEITQNFLDSFQIDADQITDQPDSIANLQRDYQLQAPSQSTTGSSDESLVARDFNFQLVLDCLAKSYVNVDQIKKHYQLIVNEHLLYGIDEIKMAQMIVRATNVKNNVFSPQKLKLLVSRMYQPKHQPASPNVAQQDAVSVDAGEFSQTERTLIQGAEHYAPVSFLYKLKAKQNGFVAKDEEDMIAELVERHIMSTGAVNMLTYHILVDQGKPKLTKSFFNYIANDWTQTYHVQSAADAMNAIKAYNQKQSQPSAKRGGYYRKPAPKTHVEPAWLNDKDYNKKKGKPVSAEKRKRVEALLKKFDHD